ncbi:MAG: type III-B CRISPR module RAMP protein Cmr1 [Egibacteraceae bacterium]
MPVDRRWHDVLVETVTPLAMGGAAQRGAEGAEPLRARSVRGLLRTWTRFLAGSRMTPEALRELERKVYGGVHGKVTESPVKVRVMSHGRVDRDAWGTGPGGAEGSHGERRADEVTGKHGKYVKGVRYLGDVSFRETRAAPARHLVQPGQRCTVGLRYLGDQDRHEWLLWASLWLLVHLGGAGSRSSRAFGGLAVARAPERGRAVLGDDVPWSFGETPEVCGAALQRGLRALSGGADARFGEPVRRTGYGTLDATTVWVVTPSFGSVAEAQRHLGDTLFAYRHHREPDTSAVLSGSATLERPAWGLPLRMPNAILEPASGDNRWPSPITFRVQRLEGDLFALVVVARDVALMNARAGHTTYTTEVDGLRDRGAVPKLLAQVEDEQWSGDQTHRLLAVWPS